MEAHQRQAVGSGGAAAGRRRRGDGGQVLCDVPHSGLLSAVQEAQGAGAEGGRRRAEQHGDAAGGTAHVARGGAGVEARDLGEFGRDDGGAGADASG